MARRNTKKAQNDDVVVIKKYANRRLYNTETSSYVTLDDLCEMVKEGKDFAVYDAKSDEELTRQILTQIIFEQESKGQHLLPVKFLRSLITFYDGKMQEYVPPYLEAMMETFSQNQSQMREFMKKTADATGDAAASGSGDDASPFTQLEEIGKQNMELFQKAFSMFSPFDSGFGWTDDEKKRSGTK